MKIKENPTHSYLNLSNCIRIIASDAVEKARSGHPGMPLGMADVMTVLAFDFLQFNPHDPLWSSRDRLVLSAGHGSMLLYAFYYLTGYKDFTLDDIKQFRQLHSKTPGHPEYGAYEAIETTTGPLGQGLANAVGMAIAAKKYQQQLQEDQVAQELCNYKVYCIVGDGCLMEGISYEAASIAGHLGLNNLIVLFDDNRISIDGRTNLSVSENHLAKFTALGWNVDSINGHDFEQINSSILRAQDSKKPTFIACRTLIAKGCINKVDSEAAHGAPLGSDEVKLLKENIGAVLEEFAIPKQLEERWKSAWLRNKENYEQWQQATIALPSIRKSELIHNLQKNNNRSISSPAIQNNELAAKFLHGKPEATRVSSGKLLEELMSYNSNIICGSADLSFSNNIKNSLSKVITKDDFSGNYIHYGVREHAMAAIMNGLALSGFLPIGGTFFVFSDYMRPAIRLAALMQLKVIYVMTHDSIGVGEDGPTHQPIEHLASLRAMPNLLVLRPADAAETLECWKIALANEKGPSMLVLTRQNLPQIRKQLTAENLCSKGAYVIQDSKQENPIGLFATGSELSIAMEVAAILNTAGHATKVISLPCFELFFQQSKEYITTITRGYKLKVAIEAASSFGWHKIIEEDGLFFGIDQFGASAPADKLYEYFGLNAENIANQILASKNSSSV